MSQEVVIVIRTGQDTISVTVKDVNGRVTARLREQPIQKELAEYLRDALTKYAEWEVQDAQGDNGCG